MEEEPPDLIQKVPAEWRRRWGEVAWAGSERKSRTSGEIRLGFLAVDFFEAGG